jgi:hypothetical protein
MSGAGRKTMARTLGRNTFLQRLIGAAALDTAIYEEVEADEGATAQALAVVVLSSLSAGIGIGDLGGTSVSAMVFVSIVSLLAWGAWALLTYQIGTRILPGMRTEADVGQLLRTIGFASAPGMLRALGMLPGVTGPVFLVTWIWMLAAMVVGVRQALDYQSTARAILVCVIGWVLAGVLAVVIGLAFGPGLQ